MDPMNAFTQKPLAPIWITGPRLRQRWGDMPKSTFYERRSRGLIPEPEFPFGPNRPYWRMEAIERFEAASKVAS